VSAFWTNERTSGNGAVALWFHIRCLRRAVPECERSAAKNTMRRNVIITWFIGIWLAVVGQAVAFQSDYISVKAEENGPDLMLVNN
jgi:hypothetical protein